MKELRDYKLLSLLLSVLIHIGIGAFLIRVMNFNFQNDIISSDYVNINLSEKIISDATNVSEEEIPPLAEQTMNTGDKSIDAEKYYMDLKSQETDSSSLEQIYTEPTLNVELKYPAGWTYIDQNVKNKLDGVTFWLNSDKYDPPPYIHLEVMEKYLFDPRRFSDSLKLKDFTLYYNEPEETAGFIKQVVYIRTGTEVDFSIKLMMVGKDQFRSFQPTFFAIVKSFRFGTSLF
ncbi:MAG: hypothetical protein Kow0098_15750 [Ignavibacteriaceae bacterium]